MPSVTVILLCQLAGELIVGALRLPVPGPVLGMAFLFAGFLWRGAIPEGLARACDMLLANLSLLFVPAGVGVMALWGVIGQGLAPIAVAILASTLLGLAAAGLTARFVMRRVARAHSEGER
jgi:holin-like protein